MDRHEFDKGYSRLFSYYQAKENPARTQVWFDKLRHAQVRPFLEAVDMWITAERFFPTLGQITSLTYKCRSPQEQGEVDQDLKLSPEEEALNRDLFPLFNRYLARKTSRDEWVAQMKYFAEKHGLLDKMDFSDLEPVDPWE